MNYYEHHLGDYARDTWHLSLIEDAVYTRMIRRYYLQEGPLPAEIAAVARLVGARESEALAAVEAVLAEFFTLQADGWHNKRCDEEVARFRDKTGKAKASAAARWAGHAPVMPSDSERNANAMRTHSEGNAHQTPDTSLQTPDTSLHTPEKQKQKQKPPSATPTAFVPPDWVPAEAWAGFEAMRRRERHPLTHRAASLIVKALDRLRDEGHDPGDVLDQSTRNGWRDVFQIRTASARAGPAAKPKTVAAYDAIGAKIDELSTVVPGRDRARIAGHDPAEP